MVAGAMMDKRVSRVIQAEKSLRKAMKKGGGKRQSKELSKALLSQAYTRKNTGHTKLVLPRAPRARGRKRRKNPDASAKLPPYLIETRDRGGKLHPSAAAWTPGEAIKVGRALLRSGHGVRVTGPAK